ncbi:MAG: S9 family peptidase [Alistipes sp.]|nr:S9 family peptidase [Alistipes sp.]
MKLKFILLAFALFGGVCVASAQDEDTTEKPKTRNFQQLANRIADQKHNFQVLEKKVEDVLLFEYLKDYAIIDKVRLAGPARQPQNKEFRRTGNPFYDQFLDNKFVFHAYVFFPKNTKQNKKYPLIVMPHGGIHGTFSSGNRHFLRELLAQGYIVVAPDYRGSTGYGKGFWQSIDYGGLENEDVLVATKYMIENYSIVDKNRVGLMGWSHGGMITLMNSCRYPDVYACGYAGVPVSDVNFRLTYHSKAYGRLFSDKYHVGKTTAEAPEEYARRSPVSYAKDLRIPLMITTTENDNDVSVKEVQRMIDALKSHNKKFEYKVYGPSDGAHFVDRLDSKDATERRFEAHKFLNRYLKPSKPFRTHEDMRKASYYFN